MASIQIDNLSLGGLSARDDNYLTHSRGLMSWVATLDHKRIGVMYLLTVLTAFLLGGVFAMLIRVQLLKPEGVLFQSPSATAAAASASDTKSQPEASASGETAEGRVSGESPLRTYNKIFTAHGAVMIFLVLIPGIPAAMGNFVLPLMLGAKDVAFPRLNLWSYYIFVIGMVVALASIVLGGVDTGWTFYTPYSAETRGEVVLLVAGAFILGFSSIFTGINFIATIHTLRPPGMTWFRMPLFLWALYSTAIIQILATPVLGITLLLLILERTFQLGIFNPEWGGDPVLFQHFFWFYSHPAVYIMILPAMGVMSELVSTFSRREIFGYRFIALSSVAIATIGFLIWGHHMFPNGQSSLLNTIFSAATMLVSIPSAIKVWNWLATMYKGSIDFRTPMCYAMAFLSLFAIGGLTGLYLATLTINFHVHDTYFLVAHFHYVMVGGVMIMFVGALHYWWPKITGRMYNEPLGRIGCLMQWIGFNLTFFPQFLMGTRYGMPRRWGTYEALPECQPYHVWSSLGAFMQMAAMLLVAAYLIYSLYRGRKAPANPWGGSTLEWTCPSPPPHDNFKTHPVVGNPYDHRGLEYDEKTDGYVRTNVGRIS